MRRKSSVADTWERTAHWLAFYDLLLVLIAAPTLIFPGKWTMVGAALILFGMLGRWRSLGRLSVRTALDLPIALLILMAAVGSAVTAVPATSVAKFWGIVLGVALYYALANGLTTPKRRALFAYGIVAAGAGVTALALVGTDWPVARIVALPWIDGMYQWFPVVVRGLAGSGFPRSIDLINPRVVGGTLALLFPYAVALSWNELPNSRLRRIGLLAAIAFMGVVLVLSQSISAIGGALVALWLTIVVLDRTRRGLWLVGGTVLGAIALALFWSQIGVRGLASIFSMSSRVQPTETRAAFGVVSRLEIWPRAIQMIHDMPYTGIGLNTFPWIMDRFYSGYVLGPEPHAHNFFLQTAVDLGLPGLVALVWLLLAFARTLATVYREPTERAVRPIALGIGAGLLAYLLFGTIDTVALGANHGVFFWALLGLGVSLQIGTARAPDAHVGSWRWLNRGMTALLGLVLIAPMVWDGPLLNTGRVLAHRVILSSSGRDADVTAMRQAASYLGHAVRVDPTNSGTWYLLGTLAAHQENTTLAIAALRRGVALDRYDPLKRYALGEVLLEHERKIDWVGLQSVYSQWIARYPTRAEWYVAASIASCEGRGDAVAAQALISRGLAARAEPAGVLHAYQTILGEPPACTTRLQRGA